jgi:N-acetyl-gamma-glutamyl-phosphate reductase
MIKVAIIGGSGYAGVELIRLLSLHPRVKLAAVTSEQSSGKQVGKVFPSLQHAISLEYEALDIPALAQKADFFFVALPSGSAMESVAQLIEKNKKVVDLSADYRLKNADEYKQWYLQDHRYIPLLGRSVYGL